LVLINTHRHRHNSLTTPPTWGFCVCSHIQPEVFLMDFWR
jgi:hypothetical protein